MKNFLVNNFSSIRRIVFFGMIISLTAVFSFADQANADSEGNMDIWIKGSMNNDFANDILIEVNKEREKAGLPSLKMDSGLTESAGIRARECIIRYSHDRPVPSDWTAIIPSGYKHAGENLAIGYSSAADAVDAWMDSPTHRANVLGTDYKALGAAVFEYNNSLTGKTVYTCAQHFSNSFDGEYKNSGKETSVYAVADDEDYYPLKLNVLIGNEKVPPELTLSPGENVATSIKITADEMWGQKFVIAEPETLIWNVADPEVADITTDGTINAKTIGNTTMEAVSSDNSFSKILDIYVKKSIYSTEIGWIDPQYYTGNEIEPDVVVHDGEEKLVKDEDYKVVYSDNIFPGTAKAHIVGMGDYGGERVMYFSVYDDSTVISRSTLFLKHIQDFFYNLIPQSR